MARIINIASGKGGVGKTTTAINLGIALTKYFNKRVALVDCNLTTAHIGLYLGLYSTPITLNSVLRGESTLGGALYVHPSGLRIIPASLNLQDLQGIDDTLLTNTIRELSESFDIILLDSAPGIGKEAMMALKACSEVLFIANPFIPSTVDIVKLTNLCIKLTQDGVTDIKPIGVLLNRSTEDDYELTKDEIESLTTLPIIGKIPEDKNILQSVNSKTPVILFNPDSDASKAYRMVAAQLIGESYVEEVKPIETVPKIEKKKPKKGIRKKRTPSKIDKKVEVIKEIETQEKPEAKTEPIEEPVIEMGVKETPKPFEISEPTVLTEMEESEIEEKAQEFLEKRESRRQGLFGKVIGFFSKFRRSRKELI